MNCYWCGHDAMKHGEAGCTAIEYVGFASNPTADPCECRRTAVAAMMAPPEPEE